MFLKKQECSVLYTNLENFQTLLKLQLETTIAHIRSSYLAKL